MSRIFFITQCYQCPNVIKMEGNQYCNVIREDRLIKGDIIPDFCFLQDEKDFFANRFFNKCNDMDCDFTGRVMKALDAEDKI